MVKLDETDTGVVLEALRTYQQTVPESTGKKIDELCERINADEEMFKGREDPIQSEGLKDVYGEMAIKSLGEAHAMAGAQLSIRDGAISSLVSCSVPLPDSKFWALCDNLEVEWSRAKPNTKLACDRFLWSLLFKEEQKAVTAIRFVSTYVSKVAELYKPLFEVIEGYGDDGYGDLLDSFPLFGQERYELVLQGKIEGPSSSQGQGENYFRSTLEKVLAEKIGYIAVRIEEDGEE